MMAIEVWLYIEIGFDWWAIELAAVAVYATSSKMSKGMAGEGVYSNYDSIRQEYQTSNSYWIAESYRFVEIKIEERKDSYWSI